MGEIGYFYVILDLMGMLSMILFFVGLGFNSSDYF